MSDRSDALQRALKKIAADLAPKSCARAARITTLGSIGGQLVLVGELQPFSFDPLSARLRGGEARFGCEDGYARKTRYGLQARSG
jgi:hypothetical protein